MIDLDLKKKILSEEVIRDQIIGVAATIQTIDQRKAAFMNNLETIAERRDQDHSNELAHKPSNASSKHSIVPQNMMR